ncbi:helix-turn-helix domain-containing protein [Cellulosimicrobium sp. SH8]|uniref:helix-turn-helix domain-containing protein n=1 Tax=Cellulosimicrobium sp. SH8 TaxID=2952936 RepID=UPI0021F312E6|nr:helix-turn-helix domain-containing protein [Cellulosimicrobium sp. SH8]
MSVESMALALHHSRAKGTTKLVLLGIANHDGDGGAWPALSTLARYAGGVDERTVRRSLRELEALGEIRVHVNGGGDRSTPGDRRPNLYEVLVACPSNCDRTARHRLVDGGTSVSARPTNGGTRTSSRGSDGGTPVSERGDVGVRDGGTWVSGEPSFEPSTNRPRREAPEEASPARDDLGDAPSPFEDLGGNTAPGPVPLTRPDRCPRHQLDDDAPPCWGCKAARERAEQAAKDAAHAEAERQRQERHTAAVQARAAIRFCPLCDERGYISVPGKGARVCDHDLSPEQEERARLGRELVEQARRAAAEGNTTTEGDE